MITRFTMCSAEEPAKKKTGTVRFYLV